MFKFDSSPATAISPVKHTLALIEISSKCKTATGFRVSATLPYFQLILPVAFYVPNDVLWTDDSGDIIRAIKPS